MESISGRNGKSFLYVFCQLLLQTYVTSTGPTLDILENHCPRCEILSLGYGMPCALVIYSWGGFMPACKILLFKQ